MVEFLNFNGHFNYESSVKLNLIAETTLAFYT